MTQVQLNYHANKEQARHNLATELQAQQELAESIRHSMVEEQFSGQNAASNTLQAKSAWKNAKSNATNAKTNVRNAKTNEKNAVTNAKNAETNARNAATNEFNAYVNSKKVNAEVEKLKSDTALTDTKRENYLFELLSKTGAVGKGVSAAVLLSKLASSGALSKATADLVDGGSQAVKDLTAAVQGGSKSDIAKAVTNFKEQTKGLADVLGIHNLTIKYDKKSGLPYIGKKSKTQRGSSGTKHGGGGGKTTVFKSHAGKPDKSK